jgi:hypothetical protein
VKDKENATNLTLKKVLMVFVGLLTVFVGLLVVVDGFLMAC